MYVVLFIVVICVFGGVVAPYATRKTHDAVQTGDPAVAARIGVTLAVLAFMLPLVTTYVATVFLYDLFGWQALLIPGIGLMFGIHLGALSLFCGIRSFSQPIGKILTFSTLAVLALWCWTVFERFFA